MISRSQMRHREEMNLRHKIESFRRVDGDSLQKKCQMIKSLSTTTINIRKDLQLKQKQENYFRAKKNSEKAMRFKAALSKELFAQNYKKKKVIDTIKNNGALKKVIFEKNKQRETKHRYEEELKREKKAIRKIESKI